MSIDPAVVQQQVSARVAVLRQRPYDELAALPESAWEDVAFGRTSATFQTLREGDAGDDVTIIVQCFPEGSRTRIFWRFYTWIGVYADGFPVKPDGRVTAISQAHRLAYM